MTAHSKWNDTFYHRAYCQARSGASDRQIAAALGVSPQALITWKKKKPALVKAVEEGRKDASGPTTRTFLDHVYEQLPDHLKEVWEKLGMAQNSDNPRERIQLILSPHGKLARQQLFLYALVAGNFNMSWACKQVCVASSTLAKWRNNDKDFQEVLKEMEWHKGNFFESQLCKLVQEGEPSVVIFANKTFNKSRGYGEQVKVNVNGKVDHDHKHEHKHVHAMLDPATLPTEFLIYLDNLEKPKELTTSTDNVLAPDYPTVLSEGMEEHV